MFDGVLFFIYLHVLYYSGVGWCLRWSGVCLCVTTTPEVTTGRTASPPALDSYELSWQTVVSLSLSVSWCSCTAHSMGSCELCVLGFRTPLGTWVVSGLHCLPLWLYGCHWGLLTRWLYLPSWIQTLGTVLLGAGRLLALSAEVKTICGEHHVDKSQSCI